MDTIPGQESVLATKCNGNVVVLELTIWILYKRLAGHLFIDDLSLYENLCVGALVLFISDGVVQDEDGSHDSNA